MSLVEGSFSRWLIAVLIGVLRTGRGTADVFGAFPPAPARFGLFPPVFPVSARSLAERNRKMGGGRRRSARQNERGRSRSGAERQNGNRADAESRTISERFGNEVQ